MKVWKSEDVGMRFGEILDACLKEGPQVLTKNGVEVAVIVSTEEWRRLTEPETPTLKEILLSPEPRFEDIVPPRGRWVRRPVPIFDN